MALKSVQNLGVAGTAGVEPEAPRTRLPILRGWCRPRPCLAESGKTPPHPSPLPKGLRCSKRVSLDSRHLLFMQVREKIKLIREEAGMGLAKGQKTPSGYSPGPAARGDCGQGGCDGLARAAQGRRWP